MQRKTWLDLEERGKEAGRLMMLILQGRYDSP